ncbi:MAG: hypothetical protein M3071_01980 [Actinomycetota bacterium]|nr:hypothetical protein [Actinomycetota bacterium]
MGLHVKHFRDTGNAACLRIHDAAGRCWLYARAAGRDRADDGRCYYGARDPRHGVGSGTFRGRCVDERSGDRDRAERGGEAQPRPERGAGRPGRDDGPVAACGTCARRHSRRDAAGGPDSIRQLDGSEGPGEGPRDR